VRSLPEARYVTWRVTAAARPVSGFLKPLHATRE
jgi:hypothetical protein